MAKNNTSRAEAVVTLNGKQAEQVLDSLRLKADDLKAKLKAASEANDTKQVTALNKEIKAVESSLQNVKRSTYDYSQVLRNLNGSSVRDLEKTHRLLRSEVKKLVPGY